ncbi:hypothetical protein G7Y89_g11959 [Cudoniella acicularis]|uniref:ubiquitinyl hydrolase 1 n=1 Tax=Cudoniella acicularis TaxID=354080 RepID=A0A8H4VXU0_9HELO|nr:hypothetical protein G7Y89_g11959 [Cudoniella acicularis]
MTPLEDGMQDLFDGDPDIDFEYHQDYREGLSPPYARIGFIFPLILCLLAFIYHVLRVLDYDLLPLPELLWNCFVYLTPSGLLDVVENYTSPLRITDPALKHIPRTHAAKSEAMRRILGLDKPGGIMESVAQGTKRRFSTLSLSRINITAPGDGKPPGLGNWDNSCYQNSILQGLASLDSLSGYLANPTFETLPVEVRERPQMKMAESLRTLIENLKDPENNGTKLWTPAPLKNMSSWQQQDAQEYLSKVLDEINEEVKKAAKLMRKNRGFESDESSSSSSSGSESSLQVYRNPLEGLIAQRVGCTVCGYSDGLSMVPFTCLTLPLGRAWGYDVADCLDDYTKLEQVDGVRCGKCTLLKFQKQLSTIMERNKSLEPTNRILQQSRERLAAATEALENDDYEDKTLLQKCKIPTKSHVTTIKTRQPVIARPPQSLVLHFNRSIYDEFTGIRRKNESAVRFPKFFDLGPWCLGSSGKMEDKDMEEWLLNPDIPMVAGSERPSRLRGPLYELKAVVTHRGAHENGHYVCYRKHLQDDDFKDAEKRDQWWRLSDEQVTKASEQSVLDQGGVFMLFYECVEPAVVLSTSASLIETPVPERSAAISYGGAMPDPDPAIEPLLGGTPLAASIPLPDIDDSDLSTYSDDESTIREESTAPGTSVSEYDDDDANDEHDEEGEYSPTKAIVVPSYIPQTGRKKSEGTLEGSTGSLLMV